MNFVHIQQNSTQDFLKDFWHTVGKKKKSIDKLHLLVYNNMVCGIKISYNIS